MSVQLSLTDLFIVGLGIELVGAWLIARGLLVARPALKTFGTHGGIGVADVVDRARNRLDGQFGVGLLLLGFAMQLIGYLLEVDGKNPTQGSTRLVVALVLLIASMLAAYTAWRLPREQLFKRMLISIAMAPLRTPGGDIEQTREENIKWLATYGTAADWQRQMYESDETYVKRVFNVQA